MKEYIVTEHPDFPYEEPKPQELIRCKYCRHHKDEAPGMVYCPKIVGGWVGEDCYCSWAEMTE